MYSSYFWHLLLKLPFFGFTFIFVAGNSMHFVWILNKNGGFCFLFVSFLLYVIEEGTCNKIY